MHYLELLYYWCNKYSAHFPGSIPRSDEASGSYSGPERPCGRSRVLYWGLESSGFAFGEGGVVDAGVDEGEAVVFAAGAAAGAVVSGVAAALPAGLAVPSPCGGSGEVVIALSGLSK